MLERVKKERQQPGTAFGTGRPATGRTHPITIRISDEALKILAAVKNRSEFIDYLIINASKISQL